MTARDPTSVECPVCSAWVGWACNGPNYGYHAAGYHKARILLAANQRLPGLDRPWPDARRWPVVRRLLAAWRWEWERGPQSEAARNARASVDRRTQGLTVIEW